MKTKALVVMEGIGDDNLGQWIDERATDGGLNVVNVRRRLTDEEAQLAGGVRDIRGTAEFDKRINLMSRKLGVPPRQLAQMEKSRQ